MDFLLLLTDSPILLSSLPISGSSVFQSGLNLRNTIWSDEIDRADLLKRNSVSFFIKAENLNIKIIKSQKNLYDSKLD